MRTKPVTIHFKPITSHLSILLGVHDRTRTCIKRICNPHPNHSRHMHILVGVKGIEPNMLLSDGVTVRCRTLRRHSRVLVVLGRIELPYDDYQSPALPLCYRTLIWCLRSGSNEHLRGFNSTLRPHQLLRHFIWCAGWGSNPRNTD